TGEPIYQSIQKHLLDQISSAALLPGQKVPSENELARTFGVSRMTVQRAIRELVSRGIVTRQRGSGTYVSMAPWQFSLLEVRELAEEISSRGGRPVRKVLRQERQPASPEIAERLEIEAGSDAFHAAILEIDDTTPVAVVDRWSVTDVFHDFLEQDFSKTTVFSYWASRTSLDEVDLTVTAVLPTEAHSQLLDVAANEPCVQLHRTNRVRGRLITYTRITFAGDRLALTSRYRPMDRFG
ncbi:MAG: UTRA domain-containing protein, partial [Pseudomonadota bacterium]